MATTTALNTMLPEFARVIGAWIGSWATTTSITTNTSIISTNLRNAGFTNDDDLNDSFCRILGTGNDGVVRRVADYTAASGTVTVAGEALAAETGAVTVEFYRYDPSQLISALNDARIEAYPSLHKRVYSRQHTSAPDQHRYARPTAIQPRAVRQLYLEPRLAAGTWGDNIVGTLDCDFEGDLTDFTRSASATLTAEAETTTPGNFMVFAGQQSGKVTHGGSAIDARITLAVPNASNYAGEEINVGVWVYNRNTASDVAIHAMIDDGTTVTEGTAHSNAGWERLAVTAVMPSGVSSINVGVSADGRTGAGFGVAYDFYVDEIIATAGPSEIPQLTGDPILQWREEGDDIVLPFGVGTDRSILVVGHGLLSSVSAGTDTMEIDGLQLRRLYAFASALFFQQDIDQIEDAAQLQSLRTYRHFANRYEQEMMGAMSLMPLRRSVV